MNFNTNLWNTTEAKEFGEYETLELGGHELKIVSASEYESIFSNNISLKVEVDIAGNDKQAGFFQKQYDENTSADKKWSTGGTRYLSLKDEQLAYLKGFITALEKSNPNSKFNINGNWNQLVGLKIAGQFGLEEYEKQDGTIGLATKLINFRSLDKLKDITVPKIKLLNGTSMSVEEYNKNKNQKNENINQDLSQTIEIDDSFLD